ncbi:MAG: DNA-binding protein [Candidatus Verstraetearchaeota archaeon]|nr:DNA-binding protein [Candidatus Verstraetearchaeota archaeon]
MGIREVDFAGEYFIKIPHDSDLLVSIRDAAEGLRIGAGVFTVIGALKKATLYYYLQDEKRYWKNTFDTPLEIASGIGNIASKDGETVVHCHVVLADKDGRCFGGHLAEGSLVFAGEAHLRAFRQNIRRKYDETTALNLMDI